MSHAEWTPPGAAYWKRQGEGGERTHCEVLKTTNTTQNFDDSTEREEEKEVEEEKAEWTGVDLIYSTWIKVGNLWQFDGLNFNPFSCSFLNHRP